MAKANPKGIISIAATADLSGSQYCAVTLAGALPAAGAKVAGILQNNPKNGQTASVATEFLSKAKAGGVIAKDADLTVDNTGKLVTAATAGHLIVAKAMEAAVAGDVFQVMITNVGVAKAA